MGYYKKNHQRGFLGQEEIESLEETVLRLHVYLKRIYEEYDGFKHIYDKIRRRLHISFKKGEGVELDQFREYAYYNGKMMGYMWVLKQAGSTVPRLIDRLRGIQYDERGARAVETKYRLPIDLIGPPVESNPKKKPKKINKKAR